MNVLEIEYVATDDLIPYINNSRTHSESQIKQIAASIREFGFTNPILIDEQNTVIAGHGRLLAADFLSLSKVPSIRLTGLTDEQRQAYVIADNKLALNAAWDEEMLKQEIETLQMLDFDLDLIGFSDSEIASLFLEQEEGANNAEEEWTNMPEFDQPDNTSYRHVIVHFDNQDDVKEFFSIIGQSSTDKTKSIWYPEIDRMDTESRRYK